MKSVLLVMLIFSSGNFLPTESANCRLPGPCPMPGYRGWFSLGSRCVQYISHPLNFTEAESRCGAAAPGGHLVSLHSSRANRDALCIVTKYNPRNLRVWIGGFELFNSGKFVWTDGSNWNYQIWTPGEPSNIFKEREDCVEMNWKHVGKWNDATCSIKKNFICAFKMLKALT